MLAAVVAQCGSLAADYLFHGQWGYGDPEWCDHRLSVLNPARFQTDFWPVSAANVIQVLPLGGKLLDLCSGDGFYDYMFYAKRALVTCVEHNREAFRAAMSRHACPQITYEFADVLAYQPADDFDVVLIRGAIEHFSETNQQVIFEKAFKALKPGGYFCGDTPAKQGDAKLLEAHECEWADEDEMRRALAATFPNMLTWTLVSETRTTLFWQCQKV